MNNVKEVKKETGVIDKVIVYYTDGTSKEVKEGILIHEAQQDEENYTIELTAVGMVSGKRFLQLAESTLIAVAELLGIK